MHTDGFDIHWVASRMSQLHVYPTPAHCENRAVSASIFENWLNRVVRSGDPLQRTCSGARVANTPMLATAKNLQ
jgi:hypothetical protein